MQLIGRKRSNDQSTYAPMGILRSLSISYRLVVANFWHFRWRHKWCRRHMIFTARPT